MGFRHEGRWWDREGTAESTYRSDCTYFSQLEGIFDGG